MAARFSTDAAAAFDEHFGQPAAEVLRAVGSEAAQPKTIYNKLGALWAQAERALCIPGADITSIVVKDEVKKRLEQLWKEHEPTLLGKSKILRMRFESSIKKQHDSEVMPKAPAIQPAVQPAQRPGIAGLHASSCIGCIDLCGDGTEKTPAETEGSEKVAAQKEAAETAAAQQALVKTAEAETEATEEEAAEKVAAEKVAAEKAKAAKAAAEKAASETKAVEANEKEDKAVADGGEEVVISPLQNHGEYREKREDSVSLQMSPAALRLPSSPTSWGTTEAAELAAELDAKLWGTYWSTEAEEWAAELDAKCRKEAMQKKAATNAAVAAAWKAVAKADEKKAAEKAAVPAAEKAAADVDSLNDASSLQPRPKKRDIAPAVQPAGPKPKQPAPVATSMGGRSSEAQTKAPAMQRSADDGFGGTPLDGRRSEFGRNASAGLQALCSVLRAQLAASLEAVAGARGSSQVQAPVPKAAGSGREPKFARGKATARLDDKSGPSATAGVLPRVEAVKDPWAVLSTASVEPGDEDAFCNAHQSPEKRLDEDLADEISDIEDFEAHEQHELGKTDEYALASGADIRFAECTIDVDNVDKAPSLDAEDDDRSVLFPESDDEFAEQDQNIDVDDASYPESSDIPAQLPADPLAASTRADSTPDDTSAELLLDGSPIITLTETNCIATAAAAELCIQDRSTHGTYVNQTRVESRKKVKLNNGDKIDFVNLTAWYQSEKGKKKGPPPTLTVRIPRPLESILHDAASMVVEKKESILKHIDEVFIRAPQEDLVAASAEADSTPEDTSAELLRDGSPIHLGSRDRSRSRSRRRYDNSRSLHWSRKPCRSRSPSEMLQRPRDKYAPNAR